jgi:DNA-directed RNA polymerase subunit F
MPSLNEYSEDNDKEGFYIRANVGGSHPITLQVTIVASHIFHALNYQAGDAVPTELVWSMYDLNMLYTLTSVDIGDTPTDTSAAKVLQQLDLDNKLSEEERAELISYLEAYEGPDAERIQQLREELVENLSEEELEQVTTGEGSWFPISNQLPESRDEVANLLYEWSGSNMLRKVHKALILNENFVTWSVRTFAAHQYLHQNPLESTLICSDEYFFCERSS